MEVRTRQRPTTNDYDYRSREGTYAVSHRGYEVEADDRVKTTIFRRIKRRAFAAFGGEIMRGRASKMLYLLIPVLFSLLWVIMCIVTSGSNTDIQKRLAESRKEYEMYQQAQRSAPKIFKVEPPRGGSVNVVIGMPFIDANPLIASSYVTMLEWILVYSTVPVTFHLITNQGSLKYIDAIMEKVNLTSNCDFRAEIVTLSRVIGESESAICPQLNIGKKFCENLMGNATPLLFPWLLPELDHAIYVDKNMVFQGNLGFLYHELTRIKRGKEGIAMAPEQTGRYQKAFTGWQSVNPSTKLGRPPPEGRPGFNEGIILMDLDKLRASATYKAYLSEKKIHSLIRSYKYRAVSGTTEDSISMGDILNIIAADSGSDLVMPLTCSWNRNAQRAIEEAEKKFDVCGDEGPVMAWNGDPGVRRHRK